MEEVLIVSCKTENVVKSRKTMRADISTPNPTELDVGSITQNDRQTSSQKRMIIVILLSTVERRGRAPLDYKNRIVFGDNLYQH